MSTRAEGSGAVVNHAAGVSLALNSSRHSLPAIVNTALQLSSGLQQAGRPLTLSVLLRTKQTRRQHATASLSTKLSFVFPFLVTTGSAYMDASVGVVPPLCIASCSLAVGHEQMPNPRDVSHRVPG